MATGRIYWSEASAGARGRLFWSAVEADAPASLTGRIYWSAIEPEATAGLIGRIFWSAVEAEAPASLAGRIFWSAVEGDVPPTVYTLTAEAGAYAMTWAGSVGQVVMDAEVGSYLTGGEEATLSVSAPVDTTIADIWSYVLPSGLTAAQVLLELHKIHGLTAGAPLVVASGTRTAGDISQSITDSSGVVTVTRQ